MTFDLLRLRLVAALGLVLAAASLLAPARAEPVELRLDATVRHQTIFGFGASIPGFAPLDRRRDHLLRLARTFTQDLGATILRVDMFHTALNDHHARTGRSVPAQAVFANDSYATPVPLDGTPEENAAKFDMDAWRVGLYGAFAAAAEAQKLDEFHVIGSVWSPPLWMKGQERGFENDPLFGEDWIDGRAVPRLDERGRPVPKLPFLRETNVVGGSLIDTPENRAEFGRFIAGYVRAFRDRWGVEIDSVSLGNEPRLSTFYGSTVYSPEVYARTLASVDEQLKAAGLDTRIFGPETVGTGSVDDPGTFWQTMRFIDAIRDNPAAFEAIDAWAVHGYDASGVGAGGSGEMWRQLLDGRTREQNAVPGSPGEQQWRGYLYVDPPPALYGDESKLTLRRGLASDGRPVWMTEASGQADVWTSDDPADAGGAIGLATTVHHALVDGDVSAYVYWLYGDDTPGLSSSQSIDGTDPSGPNFCALKHYFRHIRPGAERVELHGAADATASEVLASAFVHPVSGQITLVLVNRGSVGREVSIDVASALAPGESVGFNRHTSNEEVRFKRGDDLLASREKPIRLVLGRNSIITLVGQAAPKP